MAGHPPNSTGGFVVVPGTTPHSQPPRQRSREYLRLRGKKLNDDKGANSRSLLNSQLSLPPEMEGRTGEGGEGGKGGEWESSPHKVPTLAEGSAEARSPPPRMRGKMAAAAADLDG